MGPRATLLGIALALSAIACVQDDEVARVTAPGGHLDAVLVEVNGGATTSFGYDVSIVPSGSAPRSGKGVAALYGAVRSDSAYGVNLRWSSPTELRIQYLSARQSSLSHPLVDIEGRRIRVVLDSGIVDPRAPGGGMLWNRQGRPQ